MDRNGVEVYFDGLAKHWDFMRQPDPDLLIMIVRLAGIHSGNRVIDIGCGTGILFPYLLHRLPSSIDSIDISKEMIREARGKYEACHLGGSTARWIAEDFYQAELTRYDVAILHNAYPHFLDKTRLISKLAEVVLRGGRFIIAHSWGREKINSIHRGSAREHSFRLGAAWEEANLFLPYFMIDTLIDREDLYVISGVRLDRLNTK